MMAIENFGESLIFDRATGYVIVAVKSHQLAQFMNSAVLDTATHLLSSHLAKKYLFQPPGTELILHPGRIEITRVPPPQHVLDKRSRINILRPGYWFLMEQATIIETSFDGYDFLNSSDALNYMLMKGPYVEAYALTSDVSLEVAEKHLDFLARNLMKLHARKKQLMHKYSVKLRKVHTQKEYDEWMQELYNEVIGLGRV